MLDRTELLVQYQFIFFQECAVLEDEQVVEGLLGCTLAFDRPANANTSVFVHCMKLFTSVLGHEILSPLQQHSEILHPYRIYPLCFRVMAI